MPVSIFSPLFSIPYPYLRFALGATSEHTQELLDGSLKVFDLFIRL
jgi:hypothetical protein